MGKLIRADHKQQDGYDQELIDHSDKIVDLVIVMDCTGSMSGEINVAKNTVATIITTLHEHFKTDLRFTAVSYRDHTDDYAVKEFPFTKDINNAKEYINTMSAQGGGDYPEALASALKVVNEMPFNKKGKKIVVWVADAPPHGMNASGDSYPNGCLDEQGQKIDWVKIGTELQEKNVVFYNIICERAKEDQQLTLFMDYLATKTDGKCLLLTDANKIPNLIINGCIEDDAMDTVVAAKIKELGEEAVKNMKTEELLSEVHKMTSNLNIAQVQAFAFTSSNTKQLLNCQNLSECNPFMFTTASNCVNTTGAGAGDAFAFGSLNYCAPSMEQVSKAYSRNLRK
ncbi:vWFA domain-containing protein [Naegleria gruberi]|uniref:VWFA domain-containing protein n=1 Tax=Naegleria gruberi TaxID=5762 RepID=D2VT64_NAEGR|nr:vWFA domain-containing protein [Naegleria gruberi]EFC40093.1 vWFA domain-containing protein [Naegleria gruberi]|eukprot:XP_002672837.1 vWFA domain-containing protein [Naegleria gruberi strain NEG-M]